MNKLTGRYVTPCVALFVGVATFLLAALCYRHGVVVYGPDAENILAPVFFDASRAIHRYGLWAAMYDPGQLAGLPLWDVPHFHVLYPLYFNWLGTDGSIFDTVARLREVNFLHLAIYGVGCYLLSRSIGVRQLLSIAIGLAAPWLPAVQSLLHWPQILASFSWLPWVLACQVLLYTSDSRPRRATGIIGLAVTFSLMVYAQPAQNMVLAVVGSAIVWIYSGLKAWRGGQPAERRSFVRATISLAIAGVLAIACCGAYLLSVVSYLSRSIRWLGSDGAIIGSQKLPLKAMREFALSLSDSGALFVFSSKHTVILGNLYVGALVAACAVIGYYAGGRERKVGGLLTSGLVAMLFCYWFFTPVLHWIPVANKVREVNWWTCYAVTVLFPLGGYGLQQLLVPGATQPFAGRLHKAALGVLLLVTALSAILLVKMDVDFIRVAWVSLLVSFALIALSMLYPVRSRRFGEPVAVAVVLLSVAAPVMSKAEFQPQSLVLMENEQVTTRAEAEQIARKITDGNNYRFAVSPDIPYYKNFTVSLANLDLRGIRGDFTPQEYDKFRLLFFPNAAVAKLYGVKYQVLPIQQATDSDTRIDDKVVMRVQPDVLPRLFFAEGGAKVVESPVDALMASPNDGPLAIFVAKADVPAGVDLGQPTSNAKTVVTMAENTPVRLKATFVAEQAGILVLNEDIAARWRAKIDGDVVRPFRVNGFQTAFWVKPGTHVVEIVRPSSLL